LAAHGKPVGFNALFEEIRTEQERRRDGEYLPTSALRAVLTTLQVVRLVRMDRNGFSITDLGREVYRRMSSQLNPRTPSAQVSPSTVRQHGRRDYSMATSRASSRALGRVSSSIGRQFVAFPNRTRGMAGCRPERFNLTERTIEMFFENELTRTLTLIEFLLVMLIGLAPVAITIWMKLVLYRRRVAEDERASLARADHQPRDAAENDTVPQFFQVRESRIVRKLPATFDRNKPLGLFVVNPAAEDLKIENEKEENQSPAIC
jgi:hypothetical protein